MKKGMDGDIVFDLTLRDDGFQVTMRDAVRTLRTLQGELNKSAVSVDTLEKRLTSSRGAFRDMLMSVAAARYALQDLNDIFVSLPRQIANTAGEFQKLSMMLAGLSSASTEAGKIAEAQEGFRAIIETAKNAPFEIKSLSDAFVKLKIAGLDPAGGSLQALVDSISKFGGSSENLQRAAIAIQQMTGKGVISMEELRQQLGEAMPNAMRLMARGMNLSMAELTEQVSKGAVRSEMALKKMFVQMEIDARGSAARMMETYPGALSRLKTSFELFQKEIAGQGFLDVLTQQFGELTSYLESKDGVEFARSIGASLAEATRNVAAFVRVISQYSDEIIMVGKAVAVIWAGGQLRDGMNSIIARYGQIRDAALAAAAAERMAIEGNLKATQEKAARAKADIDQTRLAIDQTLSAEQKIREEALRTQEIKRNSSLVAIADKKQQIEDLKILDLEYEESQQKIARAKQKGAKQRIADIEQERASIFRKIEVLDQEIKQHQALVREAGRSKLAIQDAAKVDSEHISILKNKVAQHESEAAALEKKIGGYNKAAAAVDAAKIAAFGFVKEIGKIVLFSGAVVLALEAIAFAWDKIAGAAKRANEEKERSIRIERGQATVDDLKTKQERQKEIPNAVRSKESQLADLDRQIKLAQKRVDGAAAGADKRAAENALERLNSRKSQAESELKSLKAESVSIVKDIENAQLAVNANEFEQQVSGFKNRFQQATLSAEKGLSFGQDISKLRELRDEADKAGDKSAVKAYDEAITNLTTTSLAERREIAKRELKRLSAELKSGGFSEDAINKASEDIMTGYIAGLENSMKTVTAPNDIGFGKDKDKSKSKKKPGVEVENSLTKMIARAEGENARVIERMSNLLEGARTAEGIREEIRKKYEQMLEDGFYPDEITKTTDKNGKTTEKRRKITMDDLKPQINADFLREVAQTYDSLNEKTRTMGARIDADLSMSMERAGENGAKMSEGMRTVEREIAALNSSMATFIDFLKELERVDPELAKKFSAAGITEEGIRKRNSDVTNDMRSKQARADANNYFADNKLEVQALQDSLLSQSEQRRRYWDREIKRTQDGYARQTQSLSQNSEEYVRLIEQRDQKLAALRELRMRDEQGALGQMTRQWKQDFDIEINSAAANWGRSFIDNLVSGMTGQGFKVKEFIVQMLTDALRINLQKDYADFVNNVFGSIGQKMKEIIGINAGSFGGALSTIAGGSKTNMSTEEFNAKVDAASAALQSMGLTIDRNVISSLVQQAIAGTTEVTVTSLATASLVALTTAATAAASALIAMNASGGVDGWSDAGGSIMDWFQFKDGGIMSSSGSLPLKKYAKGGIASSPQLALFGEGRMNEAFVPLPDGRSIPVTMTGGSGDNVTIQVNITESGESVKSSGKSAQDYKQMTDRITAVVREELVKQKRPGGMLYS